MSRSPVLACFAIAATLQTAEAQRPVPYPVVPPPEYLRAIERGTRTRTGEPGARYWQQWTDYSLRARIDPTGRRLDGTARIVYRNNAPDPLPVVFLHLHQNLHAEGAVRNEPQEVTGGVAVRRVTVGGTRLEAGPLGRGAAYTTEGTLLAIRPPAPVPPGGSVTLEIEWAFRIPQSGAGRMGWHGDDFLFLAYWYPQMAAYDDVVGWHLDPYLGGAEFYSGFGSYDFTVDAPAGWVVMATGRLQNPEAVLPAEIRRRLAAAETSDEVVHVLTADDMGPGRATLEGPRLRWRFVADTVRDAAFSVTRASRWDAARTPVGDRDGDGQTDYARVDALWRASAPRWRDMWRYAQHSIDFLSRWTGLPYPWPHMSVVEGGGIITGGMEFPMMTLIGDYNERGDSALYYVTAHELAHMWVPMMVSNDEKRHAWMDEGTTTFNENQARKEFFPGRDHDLDDQLTYLGVARNGLEGEIMRWSDYHYPGPAYGVASYSKPGTLLAVLRALLGEETFVRTYREYLRRWRFKQPKPWDFFSTFNSVSGQNLDWFWRTWYYETWTLDQAVAGVTAEGDSVRIRIEDRGLAPMPTRLRITREDGTAEWREIPVSVWLGGDTWHELVVINAPAVTRVDIDPDARFPDIETGNNSWRRR